MPSPAEGPDREAHGPIHRFLTGGHHDTSPPAPGGDPETWVYDSHPRCRHCGDSIRQTESGDWAHVTAGGSTLYNCQHTVPYGQTAEPAPGGGDTDLRDTVEDALREAWPGSDDDENRRDWITDAASAVLRALAARPDADRDALAQVESLLAAARALHRQDPAEPNWCVEDGFSWPCATIHALTHDAPLARDTAEGSGQ